MVDEREVAELVADRPDLEEGLAAVMAVDEDHDTWTFEDVSVGTGVFGEIVGHDIVESVDDEYRVADPDSVRAALADGPASGPGSAPATGPDSGVAGASDRFGVAVDRVVTGVASATGRRVLGALAVAALFVGVRTLTYFGVFRDGNVVMVANDPYAYRYELDQALALSTNPLDIGAVREFADAGLRASGEPLFVATMWWVSALLGGTRETAGAVLAWYPVVAALAVGALVYVVGAHLLGDRRVGFCAAVLLAVMPAHAIRTPLGFGDHHAFDYVWFVAVVAAMVWAVTTEDPLGRSGQRGAVAVGVAVAGLTLAWEGSPLLLVPVAAYLAAVVLLDVDDDRSPLRSNAPVLGGLGLAAVVTVGAHLVLEWGSPSLVLTPAVFAAGGLAVAGGSELLARRGVGVERIATAEFATPVVAVVVLSLVAGSLLSELVGGFAFVLTTAGIGETTSAFALSEVVGVKLFGGAAFLALPVLVWGSRRAVLGDRCWLVLSVFTWFFFLLSALQSRFVGQLAPLVSVFAAVGLVWAFARLGLTTPPVPVRESADAASATGPRDDGPWLDAEGVGLRSGVTAVVLVAAVVGPSLYVVPDQVRAGTVSDHNYETARWMADYADERDLTYPDNYVFSRWGTNRAFNYPVNGVAANYTYARGNYSDFVSASHADPWYDRLNDSVGFVVLEPIPVRDGTVQEHLHRTYGSRWVTGDGTVRYEAVSHFRAVYSSTDGANRVFVPVPGAAVTGRTGADATVELETTVEIPNDQFTYRTVAEPNATGHYRAVVPYPGRYEVQAGNRTRTVTVPERAVENGTQVSVGG